MLMTATSFLAGTAVELYQRWVDTSLGVFERAACAVHEWTDAALAVERDLAQAMRRTAEEAQAPLAREAELPHPALFLARTGDLARSTTLLWGEAGLKAHEHFGRLIQTNGGAPWPAPAWSPRAFVLVAVAADLYLGYAALRDRSSRWPGLVRPHDWEQQHRRGATRALDTAVSLGGTLIKACQFASARPDLLPATYVESLATLQDRVPPHPWPAIEQALARELGRSPGEIFTSIETEPVAAASLAQVHRAWLPGGRAVALKVRYPEIADLVAADLSALEWIVDAIAHVEPEVRLQPIVDYLRATLPLELDFAREARAMAELRAALAHREDVVIPAPIEELTTEGLLVTEFVDGIHVLDREAMLRAGIDPRAVARLLNDVYAEQILRLNRVHADPHPGNVLVQPGPRLVLVDHGLTVELPERLVRALRRMVRALTTADPAALAMALSEAGLPAGERLDISALLQLVGVPLSGAQPYGAVHLGQRLGRSLGDVPVDLVMVGRALGLLEGITRALEPDLDVLEILARYV